MHKRTHPHTYIYTGCDLDEFNAHRFLEKFSQTKTVKELRRTLKALDFDKNRRMAAIGLWCPSPSVFMHFPRVTSCTACTYFMFVCTEFLVFHFDKTVKAVLIAPQGENTDLIERAQKKLDAATEAVSRVHARMHTHGTRAHLHASHTNNYTFTHTHAYAYTVFTCVHWTRTGVPSAGITEEGAEGTEEGRSRTEGSTWSLAGICTCTLSLSFCLTNFLSHDLSRTHACFISRS